MVNQYRPYADFHKQDSSNVFLKNKMSKILAKKNLDSVLFKNRKHKFVQQKNEQEKNYYHRLFYGMQTGFNYDNYFFDILFSYQTQIYLHKNISSSIGCIFTIPCYLFSKYLFDFNNIYSSKKTIFIGPLLAPLEYKNSDYKISLQIKILFALPILFKNMVFQKTDNINIDMIPYISHYSYFVEHGFIHIITGIEFVKYIFSCFIGLRFATHLEDLSIGHLLSHVYDCFCNSFLKDMFFRNSPCYYKDSIVLRKCLKYNNGSYDSEIIKQNLLMNSSSFCSLDFVINMSVIL